MTKSIKKILVLLLLVTSSGSVFAQLESLAQLGNFTDSLEGATDDDTNEDTEVQDQNVLVPGERDFETSDFGYSGSDSFNSPPIKKLSSEPLEYFGYSIFSNTTPNINMPVPPDYLIGPDDNVKIILFGSSNKKYQLKVTRDGDIFIPELGPLNVAGLTFEEMQNLIAVTVANQLIGTEVSVTLGSLRTIDVYVLGSAYNPGMYNVSALSSMTNVIFQSGGIDLTGSLRNISLKRNGKTISNIDFYDFLLKGNTESNLRLMQGDVIFIHPIGKTAAITGEVTRPGIYEFKDNETLDDLVRFGGNLKPKANLANSEIIRINKQNNSYNLMKLNIDSLEKSINKIENGDILRVYPVNDKIMNAVLVTGHAFQPGFYPLLDEMRITDLFRSTDDLLELTDLNYVLIKRKDQLSQKYTYIQTDLEQAFNDPASAQNILLSDQDEILLLPSLLAPELIKTKLIQDKYIEQDGTDRLLLEDEWTSLTYLRKSLMEESLEIEQQNEIIVNQGIDQANIGSESDIRRYYEYSIFDYCTIPDNLAILVAEKSGFKVEKTVSLDDLETIRTPQDVISLQQSVEQERIKSQNEDREEQTDISMMITKVCRDQLLEPILNLVKRDNLSEKLSMVSIFGSVHFPGSYPYTENMTMADAIKAAGGPKNGTYSAEIELIRLNDSGKRFSSTNTFSTLSQANQQSLSKMDTINLKQKSSLIQKVEITGEVFFPGIYPITENQTLSDLVARAGGLTEFGSPEAAYFQREELKKAETERFAKAQEDLKRKILLSSQTDSFGKSAIGGQVSQLISLISTELDENLAMGRLVIDLNGIMTGDSKDIILEDGDTIKIPKKKQSISVIGEIFVPNSHFFEEGLGIKDYIALSGGTTTFADESSIYLIRSDGSIVPSSQVSSSSFFRMNSSGIQPGDTIVVPLQIQPFSTIRATNEVTQIIYQMALAAAAVNSF